jgi:serine/threonine/tyrosine-interacting protein
VTSTAKRHLAYATLSKAAALTSRHSFFAIQKSHNSQALCQTGSYITDLINIGAAKMTSLREQAALSDAGNRHQRKQNEYSYRLPAAPRIVVPPPTLTTDMPGLSMSTTSPGGEVDLSFLRELELEDIIQKNTLLEWSYERRRQAQMMLPWLYLGPMLAAKDQSFLAREGITMVLAIRAQEKSMTGALKAAQEVCAEVATIETPTFHELIGRFSETTYVINSHIARFRKHSLETTGQATLPKVLVFCESGNEKSAAVVAAYLMETLANFDHVKSMQVCQAQRFCVNFDDTLKNILQSYWDILQAQRFVAGSGATVVPGNAPTNDNARNGLKGHTHIATKQHKRSIESTFDDGDVDMDGGLDPSDALRFVGRDSTPFQSRDD